MQVDRAVDLSKTIPSNSSTESRLRKLAELSLTLTGNPEGVFRQIASMIGEMLDVRVVCLSEIRGKELHFISVYIDGDVIMNAGQCPLEITPCATVADSKEIRIYDKVMERFPHASFLKDHNAYSYCGFPALNSIGNVIAVTCLLDDKPHKFSDEDQFLLRIFGQRIAVELERQHQLETNNNANEKLREREQHFRHLIESANAMPWLFNITTKRFEYMGPQAEKILGYPVEDWYQENFWPEHIHPDDREWAIDFCLTETKLKRDHEFEYRMIAKDGRTIWLRDNVSVVDKGTGPEQLQGFMFDITERKNVEEALNMLANINASNDINKFFQECVETLANLYQARFAFIGLIADESGTSVQTQVVWAGDSIADNFKYDLKGTPCAEILDQTLEIIPSGAAAKYPDDLMLVEMGVDSYYGAPLVDSHGKTIGLVSTLDVKPMELSRWVKPLLGLFAKRIAAEHERHRAMTELEQRVVERTTYLVTAREEALNANRAKSQFLSRMSHELRTPLNAIIGFGQLLEEGDLSSKQKNHINEVLNASEHLLDLIDEVLDLAKIETGNIALKIEDINLNNLVSECISMVMPLADQRNIYISNLMGTMNISVLADKTRLKEIIINLLSNAIKYNNNGGKIIINPENQPAHKVRLKITDTGKGISDYQQNLLFIPFSRLGAEFTDIEGSGIGLTISKQLMELMGGEIGVESTPGAGSCFWIDCLKGNTLTNHAAEISNEKSSDQNNFTAKILYVEDNPANMRLVEQIVGMLPGVEMLCATSAEEGLEIARQLKPNLILMDLNLPGMDGYQALIELQNDASTTTIPVIALSAAAMPNDIEKGANARFKRYLTKPIRVTELRDILKLELCKKTNVKPA